jgi:4-hydroxybenzoate polyprenyltransferase
MNTSFSRRRLILISRPRFWIYILGPFLIGFIAAGNVASISIDTALTILVLGLFFSFPANLLIYGINDIFDYETDKHNPKKQGYEGLVTPEEQPELRKNIAMAVIPFMVFSLVLPDMAFWALLVCIFCSVFYSALPFRAKANPPFDIIFSSIIYISPAVVGFFAVGGTSISWVAVAAGLLWAAAMQTYSAVPDIEADREAKVKTLATWLGQRKALLFCLLSYLASAIIGYFYIGIFSFLFGSIYLFLVALAIANPSQVFDVYKKFPAVNALLGMFLFFILLFGWGV